MRIAVGRAHRPNLQKGAADAVLALGAVGWSQCPIVKPHFLPFPRSGANAPLVQEVSLLASVGRESNGLLEIRRIAPQVASVGAYVTARMVHPLSTVT